VLSTQQQPDPAGRTSLGNHQRAAMRAHLLPLLQPSTNDTA
jgi:hypothetical protein